MSVTQSETCRQLRRTAAFDRTAFMERLSQPETVFGRVLAIDIPGGKLHLETGGSSHDEGRAGTGAMSSLTLYLDEKTNLDQIRALNAGDDISVQVMEPVNQRAEQRCIQGLVVSLCVKSTCSVVTKIGGIRWPWSASGPLDRAGNRDEFGDEHRWPGRWCIPGTVTGGVVTTTVVSSLEPRLAGTANHSRDGVIRP